MKSTKKNKSKLNKIFQNQKANKKKKKILRFRVGGENVPEPLENNGGEENRDFRTKRTQLGKGT